jgi:hypothetical protein
MGDRVFATEGGHRFHETADCPRFLAAQELWRFDPMQWVPGMPQIMLSNGHRIEEMTIVTAFGRGKEPCATCYPELRAALYRGNCEDDFGHEPVSEDREFFGETPDELPVCARCTRIIRGFRPVVIGQEASGRVITRDRWTAYEVAVLWPCTSAIILGLVPREVTA